MTVQEWLGENKLSLDIWNNKYRYNEESFDKWLDRVSGNSAEVRQLIVEKKFLFGGRILANRGITDRKLTYSNCYVLPAPQDNIESIFETAGKLARTYSYGGGVGIDVSNLRPKGASVNNAAKTTSGSTSFMDFFSYVTGLIGQEGRRGALMLSMDCSHPDLVEFINLKTNLDICTKANISVRVSDAFMQAVENDEEWVLSYTSEHETIEDYVKARDIFKLLALRNWEMAEPGILYWDNITKYNLMDHDPEFNYAGVNPCAEEPLPAGGSCLLGSINLSEFVEDPFTEKASIKWASLVNCVNIAVEALNDVLLEGLNLHPLEIQRQTVGQLRQIGLGTMGLGDMLIKLGVTYGSTVSLVIIDEVFKTIASTAVLKSLEMAKEFGMFEACDPNKIIQSNFLSTLNLDTEVIEQIKMYGLYNSQLLTCAPTGSIATMLNISSGVEPNFALSYNRKTQSLNGEDTIYKVYIDIVEKYKEISQKNTLPEYFITSEQIDPIDRIKVQSVLQKWIDASISSTINLPESASVEDVYNIYLEAWRHKLKGVTIYRANCQRQGILTTGEAKETKTLNRGDIIPAGDKWVGLKRTLVTGCGTLHCEAFFDPITKELRECYLSKGSTGGCNNFMIGLSRLISLSARGGVPIDNILDQLKSCGTCPAYAVRTATKKDTSKGSCCPVAVGNALKTMYEEVLNKKYESEPKGEKCPSCGEFSLIHSDGCVQCISCGWSKCS